MYYVGQTGSLIRRTFQHITGRGASFTKKFPPCRLVHLEFFPSRIEALARESILIKLVNKKQYKGPFNLPVEFNEICDSLMISTSSKQQEKPEPKEKESQ